MRGARPFLLFTYSKPVLLLLGSGLASFGLAAQTWQDAIGYTALQQELGRSLPKGEGVTVTLVESSVIVPGPNNTTLEYHRPSAEAEPLSGNFAGKRFDFRAEPAGVSWHAERVGHYFFGDNSHANAEETSVAPLAGAKPQARIIVDQVTHWLGAGSLRQGQASLPAPEEGRVANHSWISEVDDELTPDAANDILRRVDYQAARDDVVVIVGLNNGRDTAIPELLASAYNVISVGVTRPWRYDGHSTGTTSAHVDGVGRLKPELVAPLPATSYAAAVVSSCATFLRGAAAANPAWEEATHAEVIRALLLTGARKDRVTSWSRTETQPLDPYYGAGEVNLFLSYQILQAGPRSATESGQPATFVPAMGWNYHRGLTAGTQAQYFFRVPAGCVAHDVCATLVWNRQFLAIAGRGPSPAVLQPSLANLDLHLRAAPNGRTGTSLERSQSGSGNSASHPLEHIYRPTLPAGDYVWEVQRAANDAAPVPACGLAWRATLLPAAAPEIATIALTDSGQIHLTLTQLGAGLDYVLESSSDLVQWAPAATFTATATRQEWLLPHPQHAAYFRLRHQPHNLLASPPSLRS